MHDPAIADAVLAELNTTLERARDERLRLLRLMKQHQDRPASPRDSRDQEAEAGAHRLLQKIAAVDEALTQRFAWLEQAEARLDQRIEQVEQLETDMRELAQAMVDRAQQPPDHAADLSALRRRMEREAAAVVEQFRGQFDAIQAEVLETVEQMQDVEQSLVDRHLEAQHRVHQQVMRKHQADMQALIARQQAELDAMTRQLEGAAEQSVAAARDAVAGAGAAIERQVGDAVARLEREAHGILQPIHERLQASLASLREQAPLAAEEAMAEAQKRLGEVLSAASAMADMVEAQVDQRIEAIRPRAQHKLIALKRDLDAQMEQTQARSETVRPQTVDSAQMLAALDQLARRLGYCVLPADRHPSHAAADLEPQQAS